MRALVTREEPIKSALVILRTNMADEEKDRLVEALKEAADNRPTHSASKSTLTSKNAPNWRPGGNCMTDQNNVGLFYKMKSFGCTFLLYALRFSSGVFV